MFLDHTQRRTTVGRTPLDELITRPEESYRLWCVVVCDLETSRMGVPYIYIYIYIYDISSLRVNVKETIKSRMCNFNKAQKIFNVEAPWKMATGKMKKWMEDQ